MNKSIKPEKNQDDALADFVDGVLDGKISIASSSDPEMRSLEETILRLNQAYPRVALDEKTIKHMWADFKTRRQWDSGLFHPVFWWSRQTRERFGLALGVVAIVLAALLFMPTLFGGIGNTQGSAGLYPQSIGLLIFLIGGVLLLAVWLGRRK